MKYRAIGTVVVALAVCFVLSSSPAWADSITAVTDASQLGSVGTTNFASISALTNLASGSSIGVSGIPGLSVTFTNASGLDLVRLDQCLDSNVGCVNGWGGNFAPGTNLLWTSYTNIDDVNFPGNGPMTLAFSSPVQGIGFQINADFYGPFTAQLCAFSGSTSLGCKDFSGMASGDADNTAPFMGLFDNDGAHITSLVISTSDDTTNDFAISPPLITKTPEPGTLISLAAGLLGLTVFGLRKKSFASIG